MIWKCGKLVNQTQIHTWLVIYTIATYLNTFYIYLYFIFILQQDIFTTSYLCALYLKQRHFSKTVYVFGSKGITNELDEAEIKHIGFGVSKSFFEKSDN